jgi:hypothetical protein
MKICFKIKNGINRLDTRGAFLNGAKRKPPLHFKANGGNNVFAKRLIASILHDSMQKSNINLKAEQC